MLSQTYDVPYMARVLSGFSIAFGIIAAIFLLRRSYQLHERILKEQHGSCSLHGVLGFFEQVWALISVLALLVVPAVVTFGYLDPCESGVALGTGIRTRWGSCRCRWGMRRRRRGLCRFPPLALPFEEERIEGTTPLPTVAEPHTYDFSSLFLRFYEVVHHAQLVVGGHVANHCFRRLQIPAELFPVAPGRGRVAPGISKREDRTYLLFP